MLFGIKTDSTIARIRVILSILLLTLLAAFRDKTIGVDVQGYFYHRFYSAQLIGSFHELISFVFNDFQGIEPGFLIIIYISSNVIGSFSVALFLTSFIINFGFIWGLYRVKEHLAFNIAVATFCFLFYQSTYNGMRQWMAMAIIVFGIKYIYEQRLFKFCITVAIAMLFHRTAIIALALYMIMTILQKKKNTVLYQIVIIAGALMFIIGYTSIINIAIYYFPVLNKYAHYAEGGNLGIYLNGILIRLPPIALGAILYKRLKERDHFHVYWFLILIIDVILSQLYSVAIFATRISTYFTIARTFELSLACSLEKVKERRIIKTLVISYVLLFWYLNYIYEGHSGTYPYTSQILGIGY